MNTKLSKATKGDMLLTLFDEVGKTMKVSIVCDITGISNVNSLRSYLSYIRHSKHVPADNRIDVRIQDDVCIRVN